MKTVVGVLAALAFLCLIWILFVEISGISSTSSSQSPSAGSPSASQSSPPAEGASSPQAQPASSSRNPARSQTGATPAVKIAQLKSLAARHNVEILSLTEFGGGVDVKFRAKDHTSTGDLLDALTRGGAVARNFDQGALSTQAGRDGSRYYISDFKIYW